MENKNWHSSYNAEDNSQLRKLQLIELDIMKLFVEICEKHNLRYYLVGGTMLGAVRHQGFIPWDDDMDVGMPRPDYEKFIRIASKEMPKEYSFLNYKITKDYKRYFSRLVNNNVKVYNASNTKVLIENAWLDIFPFDGMPNSKTLQKLHFWHMTCYRFFYHASCFEELVNLNRPGRPWYIQMAIKFIAVTHIGSKLNTKKLMHKIERLLIKYPYDKANYMISFFGAYMLKEIVDKQWLGDGKPYQFEDIWLNGPQEPDKFLRHFYGDYMKPPSDTNKDKHNILKIEYKE